MEGIIGTFHIEWSLLLAQLVNFAVIVGALWYFVFRPLSVTMERRTKTIEDSLAQAKQIEANLKDSEAERQQVITAARAEAAKIIDAAAVKADQQRVAAVATAKAEITTLVNQHKAELARQRAELLKEVKAAAAELVVAATTKLLGDRASKTLDKKEVTAAVASASKNIKE